MADLVARLLAPFNNPFAIHGVENLFAICGQAWSRAVRPAANNGDQA